jgi:hypothetical protein
MRQLKYLFKNQLKILQVQMILLLSILYSEEATKFLENQGLDNFINYVHTQLKDQGLSFNKPLLKRFLKEKFEPEVFADRWQNWI